jgi:DAK2 domain fusion protein YloV
MPMLESLGAEALRETLITFRTTLRAHMEGINRLNVYPVPDGDTGTNMARTLDAVVKELEGAAVDMGGTCDAIAHGSLMGARGNSGVILSQVMRGLVGKLRGVAGGVASAPDVAAALKAASVASYEAVLKPIEGTILTVVRETADAAVAAAGSGESLVGMLRVARDAGRVALANTPELLPVLKDAGVVDAGGAGFMLFIDSALHVVAGDALPEPEDVAGPSAEQLEAVSLRAGADGAVDVSELRYEVMFLLNLDDSQQRAFMTAWGEIGDSIVVVGGEGLYNCHIHTNDIGAAIEAPLKLDGKPFNIRVTDLFEEMEEEHAQREAAMGASPKKSAVASLPAVNCAVIAICSGDGLAELFGQMGVQGVVTGGQTMNPSTEELLDAVEHMNSQYVVILPNNKNIIPVANQVNALTSKTVHVVPTCSMPEALAALVFYDPESTSELNAAAMSDAAAAVATGEVTQAVRDTNSDAGAVKAGDWIGLVRGDGLVAIGGTMVAASCSLLDKLVTPGRELMTIITGDLATARATEEIVAYIADNFDGVEVEVHAGGQPLYPYLFGVE